MARVDPERTGSAGHAVINHIGARACVFSEDRDAALAVQLVSHFANAQASQPSPVFSTADAIRVAEAAGLPPDDVERLARDGPLRLVCNDLRECFGAPETELEHIQRQFVSSSLHPGPGSTVIDVGCSAGRFLQSLSGTGARLVGCDISFFPLAAGARAWTLTCKGSAPAWHAADVVDLPFPAETFSHAASLVVLAFVPVRRALAELHRVLEPGGLLAFTTEGPGFVDEMAAELPRSLRSRLVEARWRWGSRLIASGIDWQGRPLVGRLTGITTYGLPTICRLVEGAGFTIETTQVLERHKGQDRLLGIVARKR